MKRKILAATLALFLFFGGYALATNVNGDFEGNPIIKMFSNGKELVATDVPAIMYHNRTMVPIYLLNQLGVETVWDQDSYSVTVKMPVPTPAITQDQLNTIAESVLKVYGYTSDPTIYEQGSGVVIDNMLVTNVHVGGGAPYVDAFIDGIAVRLSDIVFKDESLDLMAFKIDGQKSLKYSTDLTEVDDTVYDMGFPNGAFKITQGKIYNPSFTFDDKTSIVHTAKISPGSSGGALLNGKGEVIGINVSDYGDIFNAVPIKYIKEELDKLK